ncbi:bacillithiol biosynthesis cysteine-adding enzyme BshC [Polaribacter sp. R77954]|uniref:bacillithiol biosynthesis cysteine-adding enzyme BshC n=1 Tax=Polaribacter sp. R77954 TaxID=3093870 RepID=UPI0037C68FE9
MKVTQIPFQKIGFFSKTMLDYLEKNPKINPFYNNFPDFEGFQKQIAEKQTSFSKSSRLVLAEALKNQYESFEISEKTKTNISLLKKEHTFTISTGHQLNLFTGPLYFLYKIISAINLAEELSVKFPNQNFVPVYWMATEDHDFDEINYFNFDGKKVTWNRKDGGAVGRFSTDGLDAVFDVFSEHLGNSKNAQYLKKLFADGYLKHHNLADATRFIANELFAKYGLVIVDGDDAKLKELFIPFVRDELEHGTSFKAVSKTIERLANNYKIQVNPREINLFYLGDDYRERIIFENNLYKVNNTEIAFSKDEIFKELHKNPKAFSPNVIMRPLYQEVILPNLCYIGGGGEQAYWLELQDYFNAVNIPFPILLLRNSVQVISEKQARKLAALNISKEELFLNQHELITNKVVENTAIETNFKDKKQFLEQQFLDLKEVAKKTHISFLNAVNAQERKQIKGLEKLEKRLLKAEKKRQTHLVERITILQNELLPNQSLEERQRNFSEYYLEYGITFIDVLKIALKPLELQFTILEI